MKNLKKVLALVLAFACAFTMFAGAAFTDAADISVDTDVVDTLVALGVIDGYSDGSFRPDNTVTRAQMAKMIYIIRTGRSDANAYNNDATTFTDISGHWAEGFIKYCQSLGVISGKSATRFDPDGLVTTQEASKMLLVTLGYDAEKAGLVGTGWGAKTTALADENGLLKDVICGTTQGMPRQYAAQLIYNAIFANTVVLRDGEYTKYNVNSQLNPTIGAKYMDLQSYKTTLTGYKDNVVQFSSFPVLYNDYTKDDSDMVGRKVMVLYKNAANVNDKATIYGIFEDDEYSYADTVAGKIKDYKYDNTTKKATIKVDDVKKDVATGAESVVTSWKNVQSAQPVTVVYDDKGYVYDLDLDTYFQVAEITYVGTKTVNINGSVTIEDVELYDGFAKDDWTVKSYNAYTDKIAYTKADVVTGSVEVVNGDDITIDGTTYTIADDKADHTMKKADMKNVLGLGNKVEVVVVDGYIYNAEKVSGIASLDDLVFINGAKVDNDYGKETVKAKATFADGTAKEIRVVETPVYQDTNAATDDSESKIVAEIKKNGNAVINGLWAYELDGEKYTLKNITAGAASSDDFEGKTTVASAGDDKIGGERVNDDAVVFVVDKDKDVYVKTGKDVKAWSKNTAVTSVVAYGDKTSGFLYVDVAAIVLDGIDVPGASYDAVYGYVVKELGQTKEDNKTYASFSIWTGSENETFKVESSKAVGIVKGMFVQVKDDEIKKVGTTAAVSGFDAETVTFEKTVGEYNITDDTKIIYVDSDPDVVEGAEGGEIKTATDHNTPGTKENNVVYVVDPDDTNGSDGWDLVAIFVDVNNEITAK